MTTEMPQRKNNNKQTTNHINNKTNNDKPSTTTTTTTNPPAASLWHEPLSSLTGTDLIGDVVVHATVAVFLRDAGLRVFVEVRVSGADTAGVKVKAAIGERERPLARGLALGVVAVGVAFSAVCGADTGRQLG